MPRPPRAPIVRRRLASVWVIEFRCEWCGRWYEPRTRSQRFCRASHRTAAALERRRLGIPNARIRSVRWVDGRRVDLDPDTATARDGAIAWTVPTDEGEGRATIPKRLRPSALPLVDRHPIPGSYRKPDRSGRRA